MAEENTPEINLDALLMMASVSPQFGTFAATTEAAYEVFEESRDDLLEFFEDEEELSSFMSDVRNLAEASSSISDEIQEKIAEKLNGIAAAQG